jgi:hypothetical protein
MYILSQDSPAHLALWGTSRYNATRDIFYAGRPIKALSGSRSMAIPEFILRKLYVQGSFQTSAGGFSFALNNTFAPRP